MQARTLLNLTLGGLGEALKALSHCPRLEGSRFEPVQKNVGLGLFFIQRSDEAALLDPCDERWINKKVRISLLRLRVLI